MATEAKAMTTILVVEDDAVTREGLAVLLCREGFAVATAANGQEALDYLRQNPAPDLILLDMLMPVLDGWHFLERVKRTKPAAAVPIVITTATILTRAWANDHGCAGFVRKPLELDALLEEIRRCLRPA
jgi:two-component system, chemotaxis family, chemotaxis protein CheY